MRVAQLVQQRRFALTEGAIEEPPPGQVQARVHSVGICGSDLHNFTEGAVGDSPSLYPMVLGHEPAGTVVKIGAGVTGWSPGDRVMLEPAIYCYHCEFCRSGHHNVCKHLRFMSQPGDPGYFRDYVNVPESCLVALPQGMGMDYATLFEPLAVVLHSMKPAAVSFGETVAVFGAGPIGLMTVACLKLAGAKRVYVVEPVEERRELAKAMGAEVVINPAETELRKTILAETGQRGVDLSIDCATRDGSINDCLHVTRSAGRIVITGIPYDPTVTLDFHVMRRKETHLYNVRRSNHETEAAVALMEDYPALLGPIVTHTRDLDDVQTAFEQTAAYADGIGKMIIRTA
jgi:L-iditol 2-dehydrogenase